MILKYDIKIYTKIKYYIILLYNIRMSSNEKEIKTNVAPVSKKRSMSITITIDDDNDKIPIN